VGNVNRMYLKLGEGEREVVTIYGQSLDAICVCLTCDVSFSLKTMKHPILCMCIAGLVT
jgi:hypothetical protein